MNRYLTIIIITILAGFAVSCGKKTEKKDNFDQKTANASESLLNDDVEIGKMANYPEVAENKAKPIERSFENAPPLIPHTVKGMMVITREHNQCLNCHLPEKAKAEHATPIPPTHFIDFRPEVVEKDGVYKVNAKEGEVVANKTKKMINMAQYNCNQCHVPQSNATVEIKNTFKPVFRSSSAKNRSNLSKNFDEGVKTK